MLQAPACLPVGKLFAAAVESASPPPPAHREPARPQTKTAIYCKATREDPANRIHFGHAPFRAKFMARGSGLNYKRAFA